jgi:selenium metabolism protein YedF
MEKTVDARGKPCPQPVTMTRDAIREGDADAIRVIVDTDVAAENVRRMARSQGWKASVEKDADGIHLVLCEGERASVESAEVPAPSRAPKVVVFVASNLLGLGDEELGRILMLAFVKTIRELEPRPGKLIFANSGVRITTEGSALIDDLKALESSGVEIMSCGTCLDYYGLVDDLRVGRVSNMFEMASALVGADRLVKL